jgi:hypothetical protein
MVNHVTCSEQLNFCNFFTEVMFPNVCETFKKHLLSYSLYSFRMTVLMMTLNHLKITLPLVCIIFKIPLLISQECKFVSTNTSPNPHSLSLWREKGVNKKVFQQFYKDSPLDPFLSLVAERNDSIHPKLHRQRLRLLKETSSVLGQGVFDSPSLTLVIGANIFKQILNNTHFKAFGVIFLHNKLDKFFCW